MFSCKSEKDSPWDINDFKTIQGEAFNPDIFLGSPYDLLIANRQLFILDEYDGKECSIVDLEKKSLISRVLSLGEGPGEILRPIDLAFNEEEKLLEVFERSSGKLKYFLLKGDTTLIPINETIYFKGKLSRVFRLKPDIFVASGAFKEGTLSLYNQEGNVIREFGDYPIKNESRKNSMGTLFLTEQGHVAADPDGQYVASAKTNSDQLLFYKINERNPEKIKEYFSAKAQVAVNETANSTHIGKTENTSFYYWDIYPTKSFLYVLYFGARAKDIDDGIVTQSYVLAFNWDGSFHKGYHIPYLLSQIAIDEIKNDLFGLTFGRTENKQLLRFKL